MTATKVNKTKDSKKKAGDDIEIIDDAPPAKASRQALWTRLGIALVISLPALLLRVVHLDSLGFNSDEAVYAGQAASLLGDETLMQYFPIFRAHPLLFHTTLSLFYRFFGISTFGGRLLSVAFGLATVAMTYKLGTILANRRVGAVAALILAVMPYHVIVTRQVLLDGPMVFFATASLYLLALYVKTSRPSWLYACAGMLGLTILTNERSVVMLGSVYLFFALMPSIKVRFYQLAISFGIVVVSIVAYPLSVSLSGKASTGNDFLTWQLFRRANHGWGFYPSQVPPAVTYLVLVAALVGLYLMLRKRTWQGMILLTWMIVPTVFFEIWAVKGFQYLLTLAPPLAVAAAVALCRIPDRVSLPQLNRLPEHAVRIIAIVLVVLVAATASYGRVNPASSGQSVLAGGGGVPGGREAGEWVSQNVPEGAELLAVGPSMANIIQWYGDRKTFGLSVSPNPLHRNPVYEPILNPDLLLRNGDLHYLVWDSFSASRSEFFSDKLLTFAERYNGRIVHQEFIEVETDGGNKVDVPVIVIYEVRP